MTFGDRTAVDCWRDTQSCRNIDKASIKNLRKGLVYMNVHSSMAPLGEIRGQVMPNKIKYKNVPPIASASGAFVDGSMLR